VIIVPTAIKTSLIKIKTRKIRPNISSDLTYLNLKDINHLSTTLSNGGAVDNGIRTNYSYKLFLPILLNH
jgi:hypothetical protein